MDFTPVLQGCFNIWKSINVIHLKNKEVKWHSYLNRYRKTYHRVQYLFIFFLYKSSPFSKQITERYEKTPHLKSYLVVKWWIFSQDWKPGTKITAHRFDSASEQEVPAERQSPQTSPKNTKGIKCGKKEICLYW